MSGFDAWMDDVDMLVAEVCGVSVHDLPDWIDGFLDAYEAGTPAAEVAEAVLDENGWEG